MRSPAVSYRGFSPTEETISFFDHLMDHVHDESVTHGAARLNVARVKKSYQATFQMPTPRGPLVSHASGFDIHEIGRKVMMKIRRQLARKKSLIKSHK